jgi:hypothetical protein
VQLVDDLPFERGAAPTVVRPAEPRRVNDARRAVRPAGLKARGRVGVEAFVAVEPEAVERALGRVRDEAGEVPALLRLKREVGPGAHAFENHLDALAPRRPDAKMYAAPRQHLRPDRQSPRQLCRPHPHPVSDSFPLSQF